MISLRTRCSLACSVHLACSAFQGILISSIIQYTPARYGKSYTYPVWGEVVGWFISLVSIIWIPLGALHELCTTKGSLLQRLKVSITPTVDLKSVSEKPAAESIALFTDP